MIVTQNNIQNAIRQLGLSHHPVCVHASLRSFGQVAGGAKTVVQAFLDEQCTMLVPSFSWSFAVAPPPDQRFPRNGWDYDAYAGPTTEGENIYTPATTVIDTAMGAIPTAIVARPDRVRRNHPLCSFAAIGPLAADLRAGQQPLNVYAPLTTLAQLGGFVLMMGVDFRALTLLHLAEKEAGRTLFRRWANGGYGQPIAVEVGGCSEGFHKFEPWLRSATVATRVGQSVWKVLAAQRALAEATTAIRT
jgi:aminoglycoside N3'-acetyltransferase